jgi:hypothetical protein
VNFGDDFDPKKFKMENVTVDGEEVNYDSENSKKERDDDSKVEL